MTKSYYNAGDLDAYTKNQPLVQRTDIFALINSAKQANLKIN